MRNQIKMEYYSTYYFADICERIMTGNPFLYQNMSDSFFGFGNGNYKEFLIPFQKYSVCHSFIRFCIDQIFSEDLVNQIEDDDLSKKKKFWVNYALEHHDIQHVSFTDWIKSNNVDNKCINEDHVFNYYEYLECCSGEFDLVKNQITSEVFYILFMNREFLKQLNSNIAEALIELVEDYDEDDLLYLTSKRVCKRVRIPKWVQHAIFFRDRGRCTCCNKDLSGLLNMSNKIHYDHIIPLSKHGINDISNLQLYCEECNIKKSNNINEVSKYYEKWY